jgi:exopolysaccharide/PEP-CTERM locus tyrosine autokinase
MSIIERVAELLGSDPQARRKPPSAGQGVGGAALDPIERAVAEFSRQPDLQGLRDLAGESRTSRPAYAANMPARIFKIDRNRLRNQSMITPDGERTPITESFRHIKRQILANVARPKTDTPPANLVLVTSALPGEGKTFCAINLAISIALEMDRTVLLVDADVAKPGVPKALGIEVEKGLLDVLLDPKMDLAEVLCGTDIDKFTVLPAGSAHQRSTELLASDTMRALLKELAEYHRDRIIIFDSPPLLGASEAGVLAGQVGQIIVVVEAGKTSEAALKDALGRIDSSKVTGLLLNKGDRPRLGYGYGGYG